MATNRPLTSLGFASIMVWYAAVASLALGAAALIAEGVLSLSAWGTAVTGSVLWFLSWRHG